MRVQPGPHFPAFLTRRAPHVVRGMQGAGADGLSSPAACSRTPPPPPGAPAMTEQGSELAPQGTQMSSPHARSDGTFIAGNWTKLSRSNVLTPGWLLLWQQRGGHATGNSMKLGPAGCSGALPQAPGWLHSQSCAQGGGGEPSALGSCVAVKAESNQHPANLSATQGVWTQGLGASPPCNCWLVLFMYLFIKSAGSFPK